jgi:diguanylate cyclase
LPTAIILVSEKKWEETTMLNMERKELQATLQQLDQAIYNHEQWSKDLTRTIICRLPCDQRDIADDAHHQCRFGQWYYGFAPQVLRDHPAFVAIEAAHLRLHQLATRLLLASANESPESPADYDNFTNAVDRMHLEIYSLKHELEELFHNRDTLTGAENRTGMLTRLRELHELVKRGVQECSLAIMDLDHFKTVNDSFGHSVGDKVLVTCINYIKQHLRPYDRVYRYGGEEFLLAFPSTNIQATLEIVERLRDGISALNVDMNGAQPLLVTASFGLTMLDPAVNVEESINRADVALYAAKQAGRNQSRIWDPAMKSIQGSGTGL